MKLDEQALPLTQGQLDIWLAQEMAGSGTEWQMGHFVVIEGTVRPDLLEWAICQVVREAEPAQGDFLEEDGQVFQKERLITRTSSLPAMTSAFRGIRCRKPTG